MSRFKFGDKVTHAVHGVGLVYDADGSAYMCVAFPDGTRDVFHQSSLSPYTPEPPANTVRVRVAVAVCHDESWWARGVCEEEDECVVDSLGPEPQDRISWITADVPLPEPAAEVEGRVEG